MTQTIHAIYDTLVAMSDFIKTLTGWFGFGPIVVLIGLLFFYKIFQSLFPAGRIINFIFSFAAFTALWVTWNLNYHKDYQLANMLRIYGFIFLHAAAVFLVYWLLRLGGRFFYRVIKNRRLSYDNTLFLYEKIDETATVMKQKLKDHNISGASDALDELRKSFQAIEKNDARKSRNKPENTLTMDK